MGRIDEVGDDSIEEDQIVYNGNHRVLGSDPAEYIDGLASIGVQFAPARPGRWFELDPERMSPVHLAEAWLLRSTWLATLDRRRQVGDELRRRWAA